MRNLPKGPPPLERGGVYPANNFIGGLADENCRSNAIFGLMLKAKILKREEGKKILAEKIGFFRKKFTSKHVYG